MGDSDRSAEIKPIVKSANLIPDGRRLGTFFFSFFFGDIVVHVAQTLVLIKADHSTTTGGL